MRENGVRSRGFTLIELLVALAIFAIMAVVAYRGLSVMLDARARVEQENRQWRGVALFFARFENDVDAVRPRPIRDSSDLLQPALVGKPVAPGEDDAQLMFTRSGYGGQSGALTAPQRVGYRLRGETVELLTWPVLDQAPLTRPEVGAVLSEVIRFELRYLDRGGAWQTQWPVAGEGAESAASPGAVQNGLPAGLEILIGLRSGEEVRRMFALP
jgi:general secretion pathway protein J